MPNDSQIPDWVKEVPSKKIPDWVNSIPAKNEFAPLDSAVQNEPRSSKITPAQFMQYNKANNQRLDKLRQQYSEGEGQQEQQVKFADFVQQTPFAPIVEEGTQKGNTAVNLASGTLHAIMGNMMIPLTAAEGVVNKLPYGKDVTEGVNRAMNLPFDIANKGSELTNKFFNMVGIKLPNIGSPETDKKLGSLAREGMVLYLMGKGHGEIKNYLEKKYPEIKNIEVPNENQNQETGSVSSEQGKPPIEPAADETKGGTPQRESQGVEQKEAPQAPAQVEPTQTPAPAENVAPASPNEAGKGKNEAKPDQAPSEEVPIEGEQPETNIEGKTSLKNRYSEAERKSAGLDPLETRVREKSSDLFDKSRENYKPDRTRKLAEDVIADPNMPLSRQQQMDLLYDKTQIRKGLDRAKDDYNKALKSGDDEKIAEAQQELNRHSDLLDKSTQATKQIGSTWSEIGADRKLLADLDKGTLENDVAIARAKNGNKELSAEQTKFFEEKHKALDTLNKDLEKRLNEEKAKNTKLEADLALKRMRKEAYADRKTGRQINKEDVRSRRDELIKRLYTVQNKPNLNVTINPLKGYKPEAIKLIGQIGKTFFDEGIIDLSALVDAVHESVKDAFDGISKSDVMDAISGYGKEVRQTRTELVKRYTDIKSQIRELRKLEDLEKSERSQKEGVNKSTPSKKLTAQREKVRQGMEREGFRGEDLDKSLEKKLTQKLNDLLNDTDPERKNSRETSQKVKDLREQIADIQEFNRLSKQDIPKYNDDPSGGVAKIKKLEQQLKDVQDGKETTTEPRQKRELTDRELSLKKQIADAKDQMGVTEGKKNKIYLDKLIKGEQELREKISKGEYSEVEKETREYPKDIRKKQGEVASLNRQIKMKQKQIEFENRDKFTKLLNAGVKFSRGMKLTGISSIIRLTNFSGQSLVVRPTLEGIGGILSKIPGLKGIMEQAPVEGKFSGFNTEAQSMIDFVNAISKENFKDIMQNGETKFSAQFEGQDLHMVLDPELLDYFARFHTVLKEPLKQSIWRRSYNKYREWQQKNPSIDANSDQAKMDAGLYSYNEAMRGILLRDNTVVNGWNKILNVIGHLGSEGSKGRKAGQLAETIGRFLMPIVRVPTNYAFEATEYGFGLEKAGVSIIKHLVDGTINDLTPTQADYIARNLKKGTVGALLLYIGYKNRDHIGGYYEQGEKKKGNEPGFGSFSIGGWRPKAFGIDFGILLMHNPALEAMNMGATFGHLMDKINKSKKGSSVGKTIGAGAKAALGTVEETPFASVPNELIKTISNPQTTGEFFGQLIAGAVEPPDIGKVAKAMDLDSKGDVIKREKGLWETPAGNLPFVRKLIPLKKEKRISRP